MSKKFIYVDRNFDVAQGHQLSSAIFMCREAKRAGYAPVVITVLSDKSASSAAKDFVADDEMPVTLRLLDPLTGPTTIVASPEHIATQLFQAFKRLETTAADVVHMKMPLPNDLLSLAYLALALGPECCPRFEIALAQDDESHRWWGLRYSKILVGIDRLPVALASKFDFTVESPTLAKKFFSQLRTVTHRAIPAPVPEEFFEIGRSRQAAKNERKGERKSHTVGFLGEAREEKGYLLIPSIVKNVLFQGGDVKFVIQSGSNAVNQTKAIAEAKQQVERLAEANPTRITLIQGTPSQEEYLKIFKQIDILCMPYLPEHYRDRGSGVYYEGQAAGVLVITNNEIGYLHDDVGLDRIIVSEHSDAGYADSILDATMAVRDPAARAKLEKRTAPPAVSYDEYFSYLIRPIEARRQRNDFGMIVSNDVQNQGVSAVVASQETYFQEKDIPFIHLMSAYPRKEYFWLAPSAQISALNLEYAVKSFGFGGDLSFHNSVVGWVLPYRYTVDLLREMEKLKPDSVYFRNLQQIASWHFRPPLLEAMLESMDVSHLICNYAHLNPVVDLLGPLKCKTYLELHDVQAKQHALRRGDEVDENEMTDELTAISLFPSASSISKTEKHFLQSRLKLISVSHNLPVFRPKPLFPVLPLSVGFASNEVLEKLSKMAPLTRKLSVLRGVKASLRAFMETQATVPAMNYMSKISAQPVRLAEPDRVVRLFNALSDMEKPSRAIFQINDDQVISEEELYSVARKSNFHLIPKEAGFVYCLAPAVFSDPVALSNVEFRKHFSHWASLHRQPYILFAGSDHPSNVQGMVKFLKENHSALESLETPLIVAGKVCNALSESGINFGMDSNILYLWEVGDLYPLISNALFTINPVEAGTGTPIKVLESVASAVPCIAGPRTLEATGELEGIVACEPALMMSAIKGLLKDSEKLAEATRAAVRGREQLCDLKSFVKRIDSIFQ